MGWIGAGLIIRMHDGRENGLPTQGGIEILRIDASQAVNWQDSQVETFMVLEMLEGVKHGVVLCGGGDEMPSAWGMSSRDAQHGEIACLGSPLVKIISCALTPSRPASLSRESSTAARDCRARRVNARRISSRHRAGTASWLQVPPERAVSWRCNLNRPFERGFRLPLPLIRGCASCFSS